jgi:hypothetical protein
LDACGQLFGTGLADGTAGSRLVAMAEGSQFYVHYSGFGGPLLFNLMVQGETPLEGFFAIHQPPSKSLRTISAGRHVLYFELPVAGEYPEEEGEYVCIMFVHHDVSRRKRLDLFLSPSQDPRHVHARLTANESETLFDGEVPFYEEDEDEPPTVLDALKENYR